MQTISWVEIKKLIDNKELPYNSFIDVSGDRVVYVYDGGLLKSEIDNPTDEATYISTYLPNESKVRLDLQSNLIPRVIDIQNGTQESPSPIVLKSSSPTNTLLNVTGVGEFNWIVVRANRDDYYLVVDIDGVQSKFHCEWLRQSAGIDTDAIEDMGPPIYARSPGFIVFKPKWKFYKNLTLTVTREGTGSNVYLYAMVEYAI
jgi:hypothetical protein